MKTGLFITFGASLAGNALATIAIGHIEAFNGRTYSVAWLDNLKQDDVCNNGKYFSWGPGCDGTTIRLSNGNTYELKGCGGTLYILNGDGSFNSRCYGAKDNFNGLCSIHREYTCY